MLALKDLMGDSSIGDSPISHCSFWSTPVDRISPAQLVGFRARMALNDRGHEASNILSAVIATVRAAAEQGTIPNVSMLAYSPPKSRAMSVQDLCAGFALMTRPMPAAVLFGLELQILADEVVTLTRGRLKENAARLTPLARHVIASQPVSLRCDYVFWRQVGNSHLPMFGLESETFDAFGMVWAELLAAYRDMRWVDIEAEQTLWSEALATTA